MTIEEIEKIAKAEGLAKEDVVIHYCPKHYGYTQSCKSNEKIKNYYKALICEKCWLDAKKNVTDTNVGNKSDNVNHPEHYQGKHECIDIMRVLFGDEAVKGFCKCNAFKYRFRAGRKEENTAEQDILKAEFYEDYLIKMQEGLI